MTSPDAPLPAFCLELGVRAAWQSVEPLHDAVVGYLAAILPDPALRDAIGMIASELAENAIKYGDWSASETATLVLRPSADPGRAAVEIAVSNPIAGPAAYERVREALAWIASFPSPRDAYVARIRAVGDQPPAPGSRLGLIRILCEGGERVDAELVGDGLLRVRATIPVVPRC